MVLGVLQRLPDNPFTLQDAWLDATVGKRLTYRRLIA